MSFSIIKNFMLRSTVPHEVAHKKSAKFKNKTNTTDLTHEDVKQLPLPSPSNYPESNLKNKAFSKERFPSVAKKIKGIQYLTDADQKNIYIAPKINPQTSPYYVPGKVDSKFVEKNLYTELSDKNLDKPKGIPKIPMVGKEVRLMIDGAFQNVIVNGFDYKERPVVQIIDDPFQNNRIITNPTEAKKCIPEKDEFESCIKTLENGKIFKAPKHMVAIMNSALSEPILGKKSAMHHIEWLNKEKGTECFILGGAVRDIIKALHDNPNLSIRKGTEIINDIDFSVVGGATTGIEMFKAVNKDNPDIQIAGFEQFGSIHGKTKGHLGLDFNSMMIGTGTYDSPKLHPDIPQEGFIVPSTFGGMPERCAEALDFCCNTLMYDPINEVIIDPTGYGLEDSINGFLRLTGGEKLLESPKNTLAYKQPELFQRFWKFRYRGMNSNAYTTLIFQQAAFERWGHIESVKFYHDIMRMLPINKLTGSSDNQIYQIEEMLNKLKMTFKEDDKVSSVNYKLYESFIKPNKNNIINYIINYKLPKQG